ncbi:coiled-coil domain-containing protein 137 [Halyomorpha halys]|uniref:coiled-coil domain-containing protein 137 n=1 Tax=Halyomorpha halys TaxID=286706 RepID=UPI0006D5255D|nr:coiled-coil domain-containing protein 137 [Halyomorpha halys]
MGRKIPGKKHRGIKDPKKQLWEKKEKLKQVINCPPKDPNVQEIPKTVLELNKLRELVKSGNFKKKKKRKTKTVPNNDINKIPNGSSQLSESNKKVWPNLKQKPGETDGSYFRRIEKATDDILYEASIEAKHDVEVNQDDSGNVKNIKLNKPEDGLVKNNKKKSAKNSETNYILDRKERMKLRRKLKLKMKKANKLKVSEDAIEKKKDIVEFGEVAHHPPQLTRRPRGCVPEKPGNKQLLLKSFFSNKDKSMSEIKQLTEEREKVMKAYEAMKLKNRSGTSHKWLQS